MRYYKKSELIISEDDITSPVQIRFQEKIPGTTTDIVLITDLDHHIETFGIGVFAIDITSFTMVNWFYVKADQAISVKFDGLASGIAFLANKENEMWINPTAIEITTTVATRITYVIGGV